MSFTPAQNEQAYDLWVARLVRDHLAGLVFRESVQFPEVSYAPQYDARTERRTRLLIAPSPDGEQIERATRAELQSDIPIQLGLVSGDVGREATDRVGELRALMREILASLIDKHFTPFQYQTHEVLSSTDPGYLEQGTFLSAVEVVYRVQYESRTGVSS